MIDALGLHTITTTPLYAPLATTLYNDFIGWLYGNPPEVCIWSIDSIKLRDVFMFTLMLFYSFTMLNSYVKVKDVM